MNKFKKQQGFAALEFILILVIILILAAIGWYVLNSKNKTEKQLDKVAQANSSAPQSTKKTAESSKQFVFKEFGVQITLPESLKDLSYMAKQIETGDGTTATSLYVNYPSLAKDIDACNPNKGSDGNFAALSKGNGQFPANPTPDIGGLYKQFDNFYISASYPNGIPCSDSSKEDAVVALMQSLQKALAEAFKGATLVQ